VRWLLWLAAMFAAPLPLVGIASGRVPPAHTLELGLLALAFSVAERAQGVGPTLAAILLGQAVLYAVLLFAAAALVARFLAPLPPLARTRAAVFLVVLGVSLAAVQPIYRTPYSAHTARSTLLDVYR
jgi:hypothetical protein